MFHASIHPAAQTIIERRVKQVVAGRVPITLGLEHQKAQIGCEDHRTDPRQEQRDSHHLKNRHRIFARLRFGQAHRQEAGNGNQRTGQHREGRGAVGKRRGAHQIPALFEFARHHLDRNHGVVHQKTQPENQGAQRNAMDFHAQEPHAQQRAGQNQRHRQRDDGPGAKSEAQEADEQHRRQRLEEGAQEFADGRVDHARLIGDPLDLDAHREFPLDPSHGGFQRFAQFQHIAFPVHGDTEADGFLAVEAHLEFRRIGIAPRHLGEIADPDGPAFETYGQVRHAVHGVEWAGESYGEIALRGKHRPGRNHAVLRLEYLGDRRGVQTQFGQLLVGKLDVNLFVLDAEEIDFLDILDAQDLLPG